MVNIIINGCNGKMGRAVAECAKNNAGVNILAGVDISATGGCDFPVYDSISKVTGKADAVIDFSNPAALKAVTDYCVNTKTALVECTTGLSEEQIKLLGDISAEIPVFFSANMSLGVNLLCELAKKAAKILGDSFDIEIVEAHHNQKLDAPSGTAIMLADFIEEGLNYTPDYEYNRHIKRCKRPEHEIGMHSIRGGTIVGEHEVIFAGNDEILKISHSARSKALFAAGAVNAALFVSGREPGMYKMKDMLK